MCPMRSIACGWTSAWSIRARTSRPSRYARSGAGAEARSHLPQAAAAAGDESSRYRLRLGRADLVGGAELRRQGHWHHAVAEPVRLRERTKIAELGLGRQVRVQLLDYIDLPEDRPYDKIASIGMFEHVGIANYPRYFGKIYRLLKPGGMVLNHGITQNEVGAESLGSGDRRFRRGICLPGRAARPRVPGHAGAGRRGTRIDRRRGAARALRPNALAVGRSTGSKRRCGTTRSRRGEIPHLANLSRRFGALRSSAAGCRFFSCSPASRCRTADCRIRRPATTCIASGAGL